MMTAALADGEFDLAASSKTGLAAARPGSRNWSRNRTCRPATSPALFNAQGPNVNCLTACAASSQAIGEATEIIRRGEADVMLSGGTHSMIHPFGVTGFNLLTALSERNDEPERASRPFDRDRDGFVLGEGAGDGHPRRTRARQGPRRHDLRRDRSATARRPTPSASPTPTPRAAAPSAASRWPWPTPGSTPDDIDYINAHGTSTAVNDKVETLAIKQVFGERAYKIPVSSTKSMMGHLIAAAGATELIICLLAIRDDVLPPTINYENARPRLRSRLRPQRGPRGALQDTSLTNSFGFGGQNITLIAREV